MAKSKSTTPVAAKTAKPTKSEGERPEVKRALKAVPEEPRTPGMLSDVEIGHVAGEVWGALARDGELTVAALKKAVSAPGDNVMAAVGWLAREHKLVFTSQGRSVKISLR